MWFKLAITTLGALAMAPSGIFALGAGMRRGQAPPASENKFGAIRNLIANVKDTRRRNNESKEIAKHLGSTPPKPLQVFEYGPPPRRFMDNRKKYKYQYVCVVATMGTVEEGIWHRRKCPKKWFRRPPFHIRIIRPTPAGMLDHMITNGKMKIVKEDMTIKVTNKKTGEVTEVSRPLTRLERTSVKMPRHLKKALKAQREGKEWEDTRPRKGRWGPNRDPEVEEEGILELLAESGIDSMEEEEKGFKVIDKNGNEGPDYRTLLAMSRTKKGKELFEYFENKDEAKKNKGRIWRAIKNKSKSKIKRKDKDKDRVPN